MSSEKENDEPNDGDSAAEPASSDDGEESGVGSYSLLDPPKQWAEAGEDWREVVPMARVSSDDLDEALRQERARVIPTQRRSRKKSAKGGFWTLMGCNLIVFMSSVCIMVLELTASRLIAKHVGSSLYTWTSVIGVVLAGITVGNYLGGFLADRIRPAKLLCWLFFIASVLSFSILWLDNITTTWVRPVDMDWPMWVLWVVFCMFILPSVALGTISPVVAALALSSNTKTGITVGNIYAWGAFGSIVGTFLTGFYLIDVFGTRMIIAMTSGTLAIIGVIVASGHVVFRSSVLFGWLQFIFFLGMAASVDADALADMGRWFAGAPDHESSERIEKWLESSADVPLDQDGRETLTKWMKRGRLWNFDEDAFQAVESWLQDGASQPLDQDARNDLKRWMLGVTRDQDVIFWSNFGRDLGQSFHKIGLTLKLRRDAIGEYHDESNYSYINIRADVVRGDDVKYLKLDKLVHSYYNVDNPTALYYEYELIYAAITERVASKRTRLATVPLGQFVNQNDVLSRLPDWIRYDAAKSELRVEGRISGVQREQLYKLCPDGEYWSAVSELYRLTNEGNWGGFSNVRLPRLPDGVTIPPKLINGRKLIFDGGLEMLSAYQVLTESDVRLLKRAAKSSPYHAFLEAVDELYKKSWHVSTMFIGGGGFVFPRWIEAKFPGDPIIHVAELDPAVKLAVQRELGLPPDGRTLVKTTIGDARNFVDDQLRRNNAARDSGDQPVLYDFVYGDAFNDFSVPWHLTTLEFAEKVNELLSDDGVYLINIIDILPRTEFPEAVATATVGYAGKLPEELFAERMVENSRHGWVSANRPFERLMISERKVGSFDIRFDGEMTSRELERLEEIANRVSLNNLAEQFRELAKKTNAPKPLNIQLPIELLPPFPTTDQWIACLEPFEAIEVYLNDDRSPQQIAVRGAMSQRLLKALKELDTATGFQVATEDLYARSRSERSGRFLGAFVRTVAEVFPNVYVFSSNAGLPSDVRDTFVIAASRKPIDMNDLGDAGGYWRAGPLAAIETNPTTDKKTKIGLIGEVLESAHGLFLTDDFAPVDNLLKPVFVDGND